MAKAKKDNRKKKQNKGPKKQVKKNNSPKGPFTSRQKLIIGFILAILAMSIYAPSYNYDFVYDDAAVIKENRYVKQGLSGLDKIWTTSYFEGYDENMKARAFRPIPLTTLALEYQIWGLNPKVHHGFNIFFYGLTAFILFIFLAKLLRGHHPFLPIAITMLFLFHPIHLEVVANIKSRDTMLGFINFCLAAWLLLKYLDYRKIYLLALSILFYFMGLLSKEEIITSIATIPLLIYFFRNYKWRKIISATTPFLATAIIYLLYRSSILGGVNAGVTLTAYDNSLLAASGFAERSASNILVLGHYLLKTIFPHPLISDYSLSTIPLVGWNDWRVYVSLIANLGLLFIGYIGLKNRKAIGFGALYYFVTVSIFTSLIITNVSAYNDRFLYIPVLGICFLVAFAVSKLINKTGNNLKEFFSYNFLPVAIIVMLCSAGLIKIESHLPYWKDRFALFPQDLKNAPNNARLLKNHGGSLARLALKFQTDDPTRAQQYARESIGFLERALAIYPRIPTGYIHMGNMYIILREYDNALNILNQALQMDSDNTFARSSIGNIYFRKASYQNCVNTLEQIPVHLHTQNDIQLLARSYEYLGNQQKASEYNARLK